jgi:tetratricopeptide (TPR) repeat protein
MLRHCDRPELMAGRERVRGRVALACGEPSRAEAAFRTGLNMLRGTGFQVAAAELQCWLSRALSRLGRRREAASLLAPARTILAEAGALPALTVACAAAWEAGGYREDPQISYAPVLAWLEREDPMLARCDLALARMRHAALHADLGRVHTLRSEAAALLGRLLQAQEPEDQAILTMHPRLRLLRRA